MRRSAALPGLFVIGDDAVYFNCVEELVDRIRETTCRIDVDSGTVQEVYAESITTWRPSISPNRRHIVLTADTHPGSTDNPSEFIVLGAEHRVTRSRPTNGSLNRSWTPVSDGLVSTINTGFAIIPLDGTAPKRIDVRPPAERAEHAMSPDGSTIAAAIRVVDNQTLLALYDVTSSAEMLRIDVESISSLAWAADGRLAIGSWFGLWLLDPGTGVLTRLDVAEEERFFGVSWSPDDSLTLQPSEVAS